MLTFSKQNLVITASLQHAENSALSKFVVINGSTDTLEGESCVSKGKRQNKMALASPLVWSKPETKLCGGFLIDWEEKGHVCF